MNGTTAASGPTMRERLSQAAGRTIEFLTPLVVVAVLWEAGMRLDLLRVATLPPPSAILGELWRLTWEKGVLLRHLSQSLYRILVGYTISVGLGVMVGSLLAGNRTARDMASPILGLLISVPTIAWVPVLLVTMGLGNRTVITAIFLGGFFAITYNTMRGIEMVNQDLIHAGRTMGVRGLKLFATVLLPGSLVPIITGLRLGIGYSWRALVGGEMLSALVQWGIGKMVYQARFWNDIKVMFVGLTVIGLSGFVLDRALLRWLEARTVERWGMLAER